MLEGTRYNKSFRNLILREVITAPILEQMMKVQDDLLIDRFKVRRRLILCAYSNMVTISQVEYVRLISVHFLLDFDSEVDNLDMVAVLE